MKLIELIDYLVNPKQLENLYKEKNLNKESEAILIYMHETLNISSDIIFFDIEETEDNLVFEKNGIRYIQLFPISFAVDLIEFDLDMKNKGFANIEIAKRLLEYRIKDA